MLGTQFPLLGGVALRRTDYPGFSTGTPAEPPRAGSLGRARWYLHIVNLNWSLETRWNGAEYAREETEGRAEWEAGAGESDCVVPSGETVRPGRVHCRHLRNRETLTEP